MPRYRVITSQAVWERASMIVEAESEEDAKYGDYEVLEIEWTEIGDSLSFVDTQVDKVEPVSPYILQDANSAKLACELLIEAYCNNHGDVQLALDHALKAFGLPSRQS